VSLGYYDPLDKQEFLQPIYIFEGDQKFMAYVPAVTDIDLQPATTSDTTTAPAAVAPTPTATQAPPTP
jgi:hypothetical protein